MSGPEIQANAIETVRHGLPLRSVADPIILPGHPASRPGYPRRQPPFAAASRHLGSDSVGSPRLFAVGAQVAFDAGRVVAVVYPLLALAGATSGSLGAHYFVAAIERERVRDLFARFVPEDVVGEVLARADEGLRLGGVQRNATVMFCDLRGFTSFAESKEPHQVIELLNIYLSEMSDAILDQGDTSSPTWATGSWRSLALLFEAAR